MLRRSLCRLLTGFLKIQQTPNPDCVSFTIPDHFDKSLLLTPEGVTCEASGIGYSEIHPISYALFQQYMKEISAVFIAPRSVTVTKYYHIEWEGPMDASQEGFTGQSFQEKINSFLSQIVNNYDEPVAPDPDYLLVSSLAENDLAIDEEKDSELVQCVKDILRLQIRPMIMQDGGDIRLLNVNEKSGIVSLHMLGACKTCPSSQNTLKFGIERVLKHFLPEIKEVVEVKNPIVTVTREYDAFPPSNSAPSLSAITNSASPIAAKITKSFEVSPDDFEPVHKNEASLYREVARKDEARLRDLRRKSAAKDTVRNNKLMSFDELMEPDGD